MHESGLLISISTTILAVIVIAFFWRQKKSVEGSAATAGDFAFASSGFDFDSLGSEELGTYFSQTLDSMLIFVLLLGEYFVEFTPRSFFFAFFWNTFPLVFVVLICAADRLCLNRTAGFGRRRMPWGSENYENTLQIA